MCVCVRVCVLDLYSSCNVPLLHAAPSTAPGNVRITDRGSNNIRMEWETLQLGSRNGIVRKYDIQVSRSGAPNQRLLSSTSPFINMHGLIPDTQYQFQVAAFTVSQGPFSSIVLATTLEDGRF